MSGGSRARDGEIQEHGHDDNHVALAAQGAGRLATGSRIDAPICVEDQARGRLVQLAEGLARAGVNLQPVIGMQGGQRLRHGL